MLELKATSSKVGRLVVGSPGVVGVEGDASGGESFIKDFVVFKESLLKEGEVRLLVGVR